MARKGGFAGVGKAAGSPFTYEQMKTRQQALGPTGPSGPITDEELDRPAVEPETPPAPHPVYDAQEGEDKDTGFAHMMHDLGTSIQEMMAKDPETHKSMSDLMEEFMGKGIDYESESKRLRGLIESRKTPKAPNWIVQGVGSWAGGPEVAGRFQKLQDAATTAETKKQEDLASVESGLLKEHVEDLRAKGKSKEALMLGLISGMMTSQRAKDAAEARSELQERALGAAEARVRMQVDARRDVADKDRTVAQVLHLYESLLRQSERDIMGTVRPLYTADQAMDLATSTILPKVKAGVQAVKSGEAPEGEIPPPPTAPKGQSKFAQWKAQQAAGRK